MSDYGAVPVELRQRPQWVVWKAERRGGKRLRCRIARRPAHESRGRRTGYVGDVRASGSRRARRRAGHRLRVSVDDPFTGVDFDACIDARTGEPLASAAEILERLGGYQERSRQARACTRLSSASSTATGTASTETPWGGEFEVYDERRFFTVTGNGSGAIVECQGELDALVVQMFGEPSPNGAGPMRDTDSARAVDELLSEYPQIAKLVARRGKPPRDPSLSGWDNRLACEAVRSGLSDGEIDALIRHARRGDPKGERDDYVRRTVANARRVVESDRKDPAGRISRRWSLADPIVSGEIVGGKIVYLTLRGGRRLRLPSLDDMFEPRRHTRVVSRIAKTRFDPLSTAEAVEIAQLLIALCVGDDVDPLAAARQWAMEFIAGAGKVIDALDADGNPRPAWDVLSDFVEAEHELRTARTAAGRTAIIRKSPEYWLPATPLKEHSGARMEWDDFTALMLDAGWRLIERDVREPGTRAQRAAGESRRVHRKFYVGVD